MKAMVLDRPGPVDTDRLRWTEVPDPHAGPGELLVRVERCGVCRTDLHIVEGELPSVRPGLVPGHEAVGRVVGLGPGTEGFREGDVVGVPWLGSTCGRCEYCLAGRENLCRAKRFTGYSDPGGYAELLVARAAFVHPIPSGAPERWAPFLCAGLIGYRAFKLAAPRPGGRLGFFGFGGSAHLTLQVARRLGYDTVAYSRNAEHVELAARLGASEAVLLEAGAPPPGPPSLDGAIVFAPAGPVVLQALHALKPGGRLVIAAIHLSEIPPINYDRLLFGERSVQSVEANTRADAREFLALAERLGLESTVRVRPLREANEALRDLKADRVVGAVVLDCRPD